jgi:hypothetical protein
MARLELGPGIPEDSITRQLPGMRLYAKSRGDLNGAMLSAAYYAKKLKRTMYVYAGSSYGVGVWRASYQPSEYLNRINNTGRYVYSVTPELVVERHEVLDEQTPNVSRQEAQERDERALAKKRIPWHSDHPEARAYRQRYGFTNTLPVRNDWDYLSEEEREGRRFGMEPNASYYVWVLASGSDTPLSSEGPYGPHPLKTAEQMARIGASEGIHDRAVSLGRDPEARSFKIERRYAARTGKRIL